MLLPMHSWNWYRTVGTHTDRLFSLCKTRNLKILLFVLFSNVFYVIGKENVTNPFPAFSSANFSPHISYLLDSREIIIMPMTNPNGYFYHK